MSKLHILTAHTKGEFVEAMWNMVGRTCSNAERQERDLRPRELDAELQKEILHAKVKHYKLDFLARAVNARGKTY